MRHSSRDSYIRPTTPRARETSLRPTCNTQYRKISTTSMSDQKRQPQTRAEKASQGLKHKHHPSEAILLLHVHRLFCYAGFDNDPSAGSPTETLLRLLLPLNDKVQWNSRDVARAANRPRRHDPNTSPDHSIGRSDGRQIAPPTKNGHAPPPIESRKSSQSVNPYYVWTLACFEHSNFFKVTTPEARPGQLRLGSIAGKRRRVNRCTPEGGPADPTPKSNYELFNCNNLNIRYWSWNYRGLLAPDLPSNGSSLRDLDCTHSNYQTRLSPVLLFIVTTSPCQDWVICAPAAFLDVW
ncbi:hypothetical protein E3N88_44472 [Mikania micrantha]|uniref:Uncharacterized protein n=1 Tax=Mikania micrantha TaxID=192012 RepID=A0A5N6LBW9_9ASTR|nr:hypothetical protein E3N88_44472 [Mikania micrantha]